MSARVTEVVSATQEIRILTKKATTAATRPSWATTTLLGCFEILNAIPNRVGAKSDDPNPARA